ncbi:hypothetical protein CW751_14745 [Brumimicrobium salinarum]|uniref:Uncharacterized protein n=1 Tax=Brumimicrobium salinarum TaxID=2058658 RepID=A0A2I0QYX1_9FLAO|nr:hypothetical protein [Brumimicrobium salinarum]PKR79522.1 hypothetical protein CW751_14745 [Brumimicrobium salinarum]
MKKSMKKIDDLEKSSKLDLNEIKGGLRVGALLANAESYEIIGNSPYKTIVDGLEISSNDQP